MSGGDRETYKFQPALKLRNMDLDSQGKLEKLCLGAKSHHTEGNRETSEFPQPTKQVAGKKAVVYLSVYKRERKPFGPLNSKSNDSKGQGNRA